MANQEQLKILKQGVDVWNKWREENPRALVDLNNVELSKSNLSRAKLWKADLQYSRFIGANLNKASLGGSNLSGVMFNEADLTGTDLKDAIFHSTDLRGVNLKEAQMANTIIARVDLSTTSGLEKVAHRSSSSIGIDTIQFSKGKIPVAFLRGCGLSDLDIEYSKLYNPNLTNEEIVEIQYRIYNLHTTQAIQISPLFISYSHGDGIFVDKLESHLNKKGIRFWRDVHNATAGRLEKIVDRAMRLNPTVLLVLSEGSIKSDWVEHEVRTARGLEKEMERDVLCPIALDDSWKNSSWPKRLMEQVMEYNILDFSEWKDDSTFGDIFNKLIDGLGLFYK